MHRIKLAALLLLTAMLPALELVDDSIYRHMAAALEAKTDRDPNDDLRLAGIYSDARQYDKSEALYRKHLAVADRFPLIYANLSVFAGKQGKYTDAIAWADKAISAGKRILATEPDAAVDTMHPTLVKASWLWESGQHDEGMALFNSIAVPPAGDPRESTYWGCRACFYGSVGDQAELWAAIGKCLELADVHFVTFVRRDVVFDRYRAQPWFIELVGVTLKP
jgi:tetratricopeptide (TPR) repeat protein